MPEPDKNLLQTDEKPETDETPERAIVFDTRELFRGQSEIVIEHEGMRYRLRITRRNKLILQK